MSSIKIQCKKCDGEGSLFFPDGFDLNEVSCDGCNGEGFVDKEVTAEMLSKNEQRRIASKFVQDFVNLGHTDPVIHPDDFAKDWQGMNVIE